MVACPNHYLSDFIGKFNNSNTGVGAGAFYIRYFLIMGDKEKITVEKKKKRIPVPKKPPKIEENKKAYDRKKEKQKVRKIVKGDK